MTRALRPPRVARRWWLAVGLGAVLLCALNAPATTRQGINFNVSTAHIPLYVKTLDFLHRHEHYRLLARQITAGFTGDEARAIAVFRWTREHIVLTPKGWPIVDDHVLNIIIRGYGLDDQMADVFTTLCMYAGVPAFWRNLTPFDEGPILPLSFAKIGGAWRVFDVAHNVVFADTQGRLVPVDVLEKDPAIVETIAGDIRPGGLSYVRYLGLLQPFTVPDVLRAQQQMPVSRVFFEVRRAWHAVIGLMGPATRARSNQGA